MYYTPKLPCDATQIGRFRTAIGESGVEKLLKATIDAAVQAKVVKPAGFERVIVDTTVQEKAIAHPVDSRLLEIARSKIVQAAKRSGITLKQSYAKEGKELCRKRYALHAPEVECIGKGKARKPYEFGVKASIAITHKKGLMVGAKTFPGNPYDGHILHKQLTQTQILLENAGSMPKQVIADLGFRGVDADNPDVNIIHRGKYKSLTVPQRRWLKSG